MASDGIEHAGGAEPAALAVWKRRAYLVTLPIGVLAAMAGELVTDSDTWFHTASSIGVAALCGLAFLGVLARVSMPLVDLAFGVGLCTYFLARVGFDLLVSSDPDAIGHALQITPWFPPLFIFLFVLLPRGRTAWVFSMFMTVNTAFITTWRLAVGPDVPDLQAGQLIQQVLFANLTAGVLLTVHAALGTALSKADSRAAVFEDASLTDALTRLPNRRAFERVAEAEISGCQRENRPLCVLFIDIDHFKQVNDRLGHAAGDVVLAGVARLLEAELRRNDHCARYGGEEFVVLSPGTAGRGAINLAERLRQAVEMESFGDDVAVTISVGVAAWKPGDDLATLLKRGDAALYSAKEAGRNCTRADDTVENDEGSAEVPTAEPASRPGVDQQPNLGSAKP